MGLSEHPHGSMKRNDDASYFLLKGLNKVEIETALYYSAFNLIRVIKILGVPRILELLEASSDSFIHSLIKRLLLSKQSLFCFRTVSPPWDNICDLLISCQLFVTFSWWELLVFIHTLIDWKSNRLTLAVITFYRFLSYNY